MPEMTTIGYHQNLAGKPSLMKRGGYWRGGLEVHKPRCLSGQSSLPIIDRFKVIAANYQDRINNIRDADDLAETILTLETEFGTFVTAFTMAHYCEGEKDMKEVYAVAAVFEKVAGNFGDHLPAVKVNPLERLKNLRGLIFDRMKFYSSSGTGIVDSLNWYLTARQPWKSGSCMELSFLDALFYLRFGFPSAFIVTPSAVKYIERGGFCSNDGGDKKHIPLPNRRIRVEIPAHIYPITIDENDRIIKLESTGNDYSDPVVLGSLKEGEEFFNYVGMLPEVLMGGASAFARKSDFVSALAYCALAKETCQRTTSVLWMKTREAEILFEASRYQEAKEVLLAIAEAERPHEVWFLLSKICLKGKDYTMADEYIKKALKLKPGKTEYQSLEWHINYKFENDE